MHYLAFGLLLAGGLLVAFWIAPARPQPGKEKRAGPREALGDVRKALRQADQIPLIGSGLAKTRKARLHLAVRDRLPSFWGDLAIYLREGRKDLGKAIQATIDRLEDPLSVILNDSLVAFDISGSLPTALRATAAEIDYAPFTKGVNNLLRTADEGGDIVRLLAVLRDEAMERLSYERRAQAATLENRLIVLLWPILFAALMLAIFLPIVAGGFGGLGGL